MSNIIVTTYKILVVISFMIFKLAYIHILVSGFDIIDDTTNFVVILLILLCLEVEGKLYMTDLSVSLL